MEGQKVDSKKSLRQQWEEAVQSGDELRVARLLEQDESLVRELVVLNEPVMVAARNGFAGVVSVLLKHGARVSGLDVAFEGRRHNALMVASQEGRAEVVEVLLEQGKEDPNYRANGTIALILAAHYHHLSVIKLLDKYGADMNAKAGDGSNALLETSRWTSHPALVDYLVSRGVACDVEDGAGMTPLMYLANIGDLESIKILVEKGGANLAHTHAKDGQSVLSIAERRKMSEVVTYCWTKGLNPSNVAMQCHIGPLHVSRPRLPSPLGGRYNAAAMARGSKIFVYGGQAALNSKRLPLISPLPSSEAIDFPPLPSFNITTSTKNKTSSHKDSEEPNRASIDDNLLSDQSDQSSQSDNDDESDEDEPVQGAEEEEDVEEADPMAIQIDQAFRQFHQQLVQHSVQNGHAPPDPNDILQNFLEALMNGEIDLQGIIAERGNQRNGPLGEQRAGNNVGAGQGDGKDARGGSKGTENKVKGKKGSREAKNENSEMGPEPGSSAFLADEATMDESASYVSSDSSAYSSSEEVEDDGENEFLYTLSARTAMDTETYVLDVDSCEMEAIFPLEEVIGAGEEEESGKSKKKRKGRLERLKEARLDAREEMKGRWIEVDADGLGGRTKNPPVEASFPPCLAFSKKSFHPKRGAFGYFEVTVIHPGPRRLLTLGLVPANYPKEGKQPGWTQASFGLHGDDGALFCQAGSGDPFADRFEPGDVIGCGVYWPRREVFFSVNGRFLGFAPVSVSVPRLYPCVGVRNEDAAFRINFGIEPFRFDFRAPTLRWHKIAFDPNPSSQPTQTTTANTTTKIPAQIQPRISSPRFARHPNPSIFVLFSIEPEANHRQLVYLFNNEKLVYCKREPKGTFPDAQSQKSVQPHSARAPFEFVQPNLHNAFLFLPRTKNSPPTLGMLDTETLEWLDIGNAHEAFLTSRLAKLTHFKPTSSGKTAPMEGIESLGGQLNNVSGFLESNDREQDSTDPTLMVTGETSQWMDLIAALDCQEFETCWFMSIDGQLIWTSESSFIVADPSTGMYSMQPLSSKSVTLAQQASKIAIDHSAVCFAGWTGNSQINDIGIFKTSDGGWYTPTYSGIVPRPRNLHSAVLVRSKCAYFGANASDLPNGLRLSEPAPIIINAFGWSGRNVMSDLDVFSFSTAPSDFAIHHSFPSDITLELVTAGNMAPTDLRSPQSMDLSSDPNFSSHDSIRNSGSVLDPNSLVQAHKILLFCRSSRFSQLLTSQPSSNTLRIPVEDIESFKGLLHFLYTDEIIRDPTWLRTHSRNLALLIDVWAPELAPRFMERLLLTRSTLPNIFASQMLQGFNNSIFSDLTLRICPSPDELLTSSSESPMPFDIPVHKVIITSRSPYFKALCMGGMVESHQSVIEVKDAPIEALKLVIEFLYTYEVPYDRCSEHIVDMFTLACRFQIAKLKSTLENLLIFNLQTDNVSGLLLVGHSQSSAALIRECINFLDSHREEMLLDEDYLLLLPQINPIISSFHQSALSQSAIITQASDTV